MSIGQEVVDYQLLHRVYFARWGETTITVLGTLWTLGLPFLEVLAFHRHGSMMIRLANCMSIRVLVLPKMTLPSGVPCNCLSLCVCMRVQFPDVQTSYSG